MFDLMTWTFRGFFCSLFLFPIIKDAPSRQTRHPLRRRASDEAANAQPVHSLFPSPPPDPTFVHAHLIPDSGEKNDDKLYFFFREKASEVGQSPMTQSRIGRICLVSLSQQSARPAVDHRRWKVYTFPIMVSHGPASFSQQEVSHW